MEMYKINYLYGPPGSGKSSLARELGQNFHLITYDLDDLIEKSEGCTISSLIQRIGIELFREVESASLKELVDRCMNGDKYAIIALGGGTLLDSRNRNLCESTGNILFLDVPENEILERLQRESNKRPLLSGDLENKIHKLLLERKSHYESFKIRINYSKKSEINLLGEVFNNSGIFNISGMGSNYEVIAYQGARNYLSLLIRSVTDRKVIGLIFDGNTAKLYKEEIEKILHNSGMAAQSYIIPAGEQFKTIETVQSLWDFFLASGFDRSSTVISFGGGVVNDLVGFAASTFMRGIQWISMPTTLLAMVDASIGGKTGFDLESGKNLVGSFYPPKMVIIDTELLNTLPKDELISGLAEVVKHAIIADPELFADMSNAENIIRDKISSIVLRAAAIKIKIIEEDPYERGIRAALNFGHTIGHAIEMESGFNLKHGEAIAIGMVVESRAAEKMGIAEAGTTSKIIQALSQIGLPTQYPDELNNENLKRFMWNDKKKNDKVIRFALPVKIGEMRTNVEIDAPEEIL